MSPLKKTLIAAIVTLGLSACHTDPFSIKPETNAKLPQSEPRAPEVVEETSDTRQGLIVESQALIVDHTSDDPIPRTAKLVRGIQHQSIIELDLGDSITLAINANRSSGYVWVLDGPFGSEQGLEFTADYYRKGESIFPDRVSTGGARFFVLTAKAPGDYALIVRHVGLNEVRAQKAITLRVVMQD